MRGLSFAALAALCLSLTGCVAAIPMAFDTILGGIGVYQRYEDRNAQKDQTLAIREQTTEVIRLREAIEQRWPVLTED